MSKIKIKKDNNPVIYKQDIMDKNGKLNVVGTFLLLSVVIGALQFAYKYLNDIIVDKDKVN